MNELNEAEPREGVLYVGQDGDSAIVDLRTFDLVSASGLVDKDGSATGVIVSVRDPEIDHTPDEVFEDGLYAVAGYLQPGAYRVMYDDTSDTWVPIDDDRQVADMQPFRV
ncbi:hypothetical protein [Promicromonospora sp. NFX87]|uniref:hypothetical protein n=1 Tax=Promicromonospora sp. NFX87 TaxID=3402691 RepID=UPI003AFB108A